MTTAGSITGLILAGGAGQRVAGQDKGLLTWHGRTLVSHVIERLGPQVNRIIISCNRNHGQYARFGAELVGDSRTGFEGPLAGLEPLAGKLDDGILVVAPCDMPNLPPNLVPRLLQTLLSDRPEQTEVSYAHDGQRSQYLCAAMHGRVLGGLGEFLDRGQRSVHQWYEGLVSVPVDFSDEAASFRNLNSLEEL